MKVNYHTHTKRCKHADGSEIEYIEAAIEAGFQELGFSDHSPWVYQSSYHPRMRMELNEFSDYIECITALEEEYKDKISIKLGLECEYFPKYMYWIKEILEQGILDYVIFGNHYHESDEYGEYFGECSTKKSLDLYYEDLCKGMDTGIFSYVCHPDLFMKNYLNFDKYCEEISYKICRKAKEMDMILEYNLNGVELCEIFQREAYPRKEFWEIASKVGCKVIIGIDAHKPSSIKDVAYYDQAKEFLTSIGCQIVEKIPFYKDLKKK